MSLDLPDRRMPVMILMSEVPFNSMILSRYFALVIIFISLLAFKSLRFFIYWNCFDVLIILSANSICKISLSKTQNILFFESGYYPKIAPGIKPILFAQIHSIIAYDACSYIWYEKRKSIEKSEFEFTFFDILPLFRT